MSNFHFVPRRPNPDAQGYMIKIMGISHIVRRKEDGEDEDQPVTVYSHKIYSSERSTLKSFSNAWHYFCRCEKQIVCCAYDSSGIYKFSFVRDPESGKITKIEEPSNKLPEHMLYYDHKFIPGQARYPLNPDEREETRKELAKAKTKAKKTYKAKQ